MVMNLSLQAVTASKQKCLAPKTIIVKLCDNVEIIFYFMRYFGHISNNGSGEKALGKMNRKIFENQLIGAI